MTESEETNTPHFSPITWLTSATTPARAFIAGATLFFAASFVGLFYFFFYIFRFKGVSLPTAAATSETVQFIDLLAQLAIPLLTVVTSLISAFVGYLLLKGAGSLAKEVIPEKDRDLLSSLIKDEKDKGIDQYIRLSSLIGATGMFTRLGLVGLPLTTVALTLIFTAISLALSWTNPALSEKILDLAKLTLGAFIGSYVQRQATESQKPLPNTGQSNQTQTSPPQQGTTNPSTQR